jgi:hypothetical protein
MPPVLCSLTCPVNALFPSPGVQCARGPSGDGGINHGKRSCKINKAEAHLAIPQGVDGGASCP